MNRLFSQPNGVEFVTPPEASVFYPNEEEFRDPIRYISQIRSVAEKTGICKIVPPQSWKTPFALDIEHFKFSARIQKLHLLDGKTRVKLNFLDQLFQFCELQGIPLNIPEVNGQPLELYELYRLTKDKTKMSTPVWFQVIGQMGFEPTEDTVLTFKHCFEQLLRPFIAFSQLCKVKSDDSKKPEVKLEEVETISLLESDDDENDGDVCFVAELAEFPLDDSKPTVSRELKRLQFLGAGPKMNKKSAAKRRRCTKSISYSSEDSLDYTCNGCGKPSGKSSFLTCSKCRGKYHFSCVKPILESQPEGRWNCFDCTASGLARPLDGFGFDHSNEETTLFEFGEKADKFKAEHFRKPLKEISHDAVEKEYWRLVSSIDKEVVVEYGADLHAVDNGSGFPTKACSNLEAGDVEYVDSGWNLNNLPILKDSLLHYINSDCSGMKIPWMYVGMCFATFCWHNEDHWLFSINYVHWGEPKIWYGIAGKDAEAFENAMQSEAPELFEAQPDLLHQLVTVMNPNILTKANIPVYKVVQNEGEFVITFPRAYHMGFNQGFNFAEAVNFATSDWFAIGRQSVLNYAQLKRFCVFSHDELMCTIAGSHASLTLELASIVQQDLTNVIAKEKKLRKEIADEGVAASLKVEFELLSDDKRHCDVCKTTCFLSALACCCNEEILVCLDHYNSLCKCPKSKMTLNYRYTLDELEMFLANVKSVNDNYNTWLETVSNSLDVITSIKPELENLLKEANLRNYPSCKLLKTLQNRVGCK